MCVCVCVCVRACMHPVFKLSQRPSLPLFSFFFSPPFCSLVYKNDYKYICNMIWCRFLNLVVLSIWLGY